MWDEINRRRIRSFTDFPMNQHFLVHDATPGVALTWSMWVTTPLGAGRAIGWMGLPCNPVTPTPDQYLLGPSYIAYPISAEQAEALIAAAEMLSATRTWYELARMTAQHVLENRDAS